RERPERLGPERARVMEEDLSREIHAGAREVPRDLLDPPVGHGEQDDAGVLDRGDAIPRLAQARKERSREPSRSDRGDGRLPHAARSRASRRPWNSAGRGASNRIGRPSRGWRNASDAAWSATRSNRSSASRRGPRGSALAERAPYRVSPTTGWPIDVRSTRIWC